MKEKWKIVPDSCKKDARDFAKKLNVKPFLAQLLIQRGISTLEDAKAFFRPNLQELHSPFLMKGMKEAVARLLQAKNKGEKVMVYGDYDVDGTTSVAMFYDFLKCQDIDALYYVPDRYTEGYGVSEKGVRTAAESHCSLMVTLDCGISANASVDLANELQVDVIVCDHHKPSSDLPKALAILNPLQNGCNYPFKHLSGCGVGFKLIQAWLIQTKGEMSLLWKYLDLLCISIAADIVQMTGENRILAFYGMKSINENPRMGVRSLLGSAKNDKSMRDITDVVFTLAPRINAAGRMDKATAVVELMLENDKISANKKAAEIEQLNSQRKLSDKEITAAALEQIDADSWFSKSWSTVVCGQAWHKGVIGIVASRLIEKHYKPTIVFTENDGLCSGSARSIEGLDIHECLVECQDLLIQFGGHSMAAGMTMKIENLYTFREKLDQVVQQKLNEEDLIPTLHIDKEIAFEEIDPNSYKILRQFAPFGPGNMRPVFLTRNLVNDKWTESIGDGTHLRLHVKPKGSHFKGISGIGFKMGHFAKEMVVGKSFDLVYTLEENEWKGKRRIQLSAKGIGMQGE